MKKDINRRWIRRGIISSLVLCFALSSFLAGAEAAEVSGTVRIGAETGEGTVVYLRETGPKPAPVRPGKATIRQENLAFNPSLTMVPVGSTVFFENLDTDMHNVHSTTAGNRFDIGAHNKGDIKSVIFGKPGAVLLRCKIHPQMQGMLFVSPSPYYAVAGKEGKYRFPKVLPGSYLLEAWHPRLTAEEMKAGTRPITVEAKTVSADLVLTGKAPKEANLIEVPDKDWMAVVGEIGVSLDQAIENWKEGKKAGALTKVMTTHSRIYGGSGLRNAIAQKLGNGQADAHDARFNAVGKQVQRADRGAEPGIRSEKEKLLSGLKEDIQKMK